MGESANPELSALVQSDAKSASDRIADAYVSAGCTMKAAAERLGVNETTLWRWVRRLQIGDRLRAARRREQRAGRASPLGRPAGRLDAAPRKPYRKRRRSA